MDLELPLREPDTKINCERSRSPRAQGTVKYMRNMWEQPETLYDSQRTEKMFHKSIIDTEVKFSRDDICTSVQEHIICKECGDFQSECKCGQNSLVKNEVLDGGDAGDAVKTTSRPSDCSFLSHVSLSSILHVRNISSSNSEGSVPSKTEAHVMDDSLHEEKEAKDSHKSQDELPRQNDAELQESVSSLILGTSSEETVDKEQSNETKSQDLTDSSVLAELMEAEARSIEIANVIETMKETMKTYQQKEVLNEDDKEKIMECKLKLDSKLEEFESITKQVSLLVGLSQVNDRSIQSASSKIYKNISELSLRLKEGSDSRDTLPDEETAPCNSLCTVSKTDSAITPGKKNQDTTCQKSEVTINEIAVWYTENNALVCEERKGNLMEIATDKTAIENSVDISEQCKRNEAAAQGSADICEENKISVVNTESGNIIVENNAFTCAERSTNIENEKEEVFIKKRKESSIKVESDKRSEETCADTCNECRGKIIITEIAADYSAHDRGQNKENLKNDLHDKEAKDYQQRLLLQPQNEWITIKPSVSNTSKNIFLTDKEQVSSEESVPKVIVCGSNVDVPRLIFCEQVSSENFHQAPVQLGNENDPHMLTSLTGHLCESCSLQEQLAVRYAELEGGRYQVQEEILQKDAKLDSLHKKVAELQSEIRYISRENSVLNEKLSSRDDKGSNLGCVENQICVIQQELEDVEMERQTMQRQKDRLKVFPDHEVMAMKHRCLEMQNDYQNRVTEVAHLRITIERQKKALEAALIGQKEAENNVNMLKEKLWKTQFEMKQNTFVKDEYLDKEQQLSIAERRLNEATSELEELRFMVREQTLQAECYRNKYLLTQQEVEEQRKELDVVESENKSIKENVDVEIQRVKNHIQEKLQKLLPLTDMLETTQRKLEEAQHLRCVAERNREELSKEIQQAKDKVSYLVKEHEQHYATVRQSKKIYESHQENLNDLVKKNRELKEEITNLRAKTARLQEMNEQQQKRYDEKSKELEKLLMEIVRVQEDFFEQLKRTKEHGEQTRRTMLSEVAELEKQLALSRALANTALKEKDEIRQRMQQQINQLTESFEESQRRIVDLQTNINVLKTSYSKTFEKEGCPC